MARALEAMFNDAAVPPPQAFLRTASVHLTLASLARSDAIAAVSAGAALLAVRIGGGDGLEILPTPTPLIVHPYCLIVPRERPLSPAAQQFLALSKSVADARRGGFCGAGRGRPAIATPANPVVHACVGIPSRRVSTIVLNTWSHNVVTTP